MPIRVHRTNQALLAVWVVIAAFITYLVVGLAGSRHQVDERTRAQAVSYVRLVEQHAAAAFERSDLALRGVMDHLLPGDLRAGARLPAKRREEIEALLQAQQERTPGVIAMPLVDANGDVIAHSLGMPVGINVRDRKHFQVLKQQPGTEVAVSEAVFGHLSKRWGITIGRRIDLPDGSFGGMVGAQLDLKDNFIDFYATLPLGRDASVSLRDPENRLLVRYPVLEAKLGNEVAAAGEVTERLRAGAVEGVLVTAATMDGVERVFAFRRLANFPVYAAVGLSQGEALAPWRSERNVAAVAGLLIVAAGVFITLVLRRIQHAQGLLRHSQVQLKEAQRIANQGSWEWRKTTGTVTWSEELYHIFGIAPNLPAPNLQEHLRLYAAESQARLAAAVDAALAGGIGYELELEHVRAEGSGKWVIARGEAIRDANGDISGLRGTAEDITQRKRAERALERESARNRLLLRTASDGIHILNAEGKLLEVSDAFCRMLGYAREELLGMNMTQWDVGSWPGGLIEAFRRLQKENANTTTFETRHRRRDGSVIDVEICAIGFEFDGEPMVFASARDVTERKRVQESIRHQAHYDGLTGVPNRVLFYDRLNQGINFARRDRHELALLFLDLDKFKDVNDSLGHGAGDELLKITASRIRQALRESDTVARVGGDEFTVILPRIASREDAVEVATKIIDAVSVPCALRNSTQSTHQVTIGASIGIAIFPADADDADRLVEAADAVMYRAKRSGNSFRFCEPRQSRAPAR